MTELAYLADGEAAYVRSFRATLTALPPGGVVLDRTFFYPVGGGQPADHGSLRLADGVELAVRDVTKSGTAVIHRVQRPSGPASLTLAIGQEVEGFVDWPRRHRHMRLHTAQHLLSARVFARTGLKTRRAVLSGNGGTIDLESSWPEAESLDATQSDVAAHLDPPRAVAIRFVPRREWERAPSARAGLVPLPPQVDPVRVVAIDGVDECPCGGTHVRSTVEVGIVRLLAISPAPDGGSRLTFTADAGAPPTPTA